MNGKEEERSRLQSGPELRERERVGLRKLVKLNLPDDWFSEMADREERLWPDAPKTGD